MELGSVGQSTIKYSLIFDYNLILVLPIIILKKKN